MDMFLGGLASGKRGREGVGAVALVPSLGNDIMICGFSVCFNLVLAACGCLAHLSVWTV